jgi:hypothetical protein
MPTETGCLRRLRGCRCTPRAEPSEPQAVNPFDAAARTYASREPEQIGYIMRFVMNPDIVYQYPIWAVGLLLVGAAVFGVVL